MHNKYCLFGVAHDLMYNLLHLVDIIKTFAFNQMAMNFEYQTSNQHPNRACVVIINHTLKFEVTQNSTSQLA